MGLIALLSRFYFYQFLMILNTILSYQVLTLYVFRKELYKSLIFLGIILTLSLYLITISNDLIDFSIYLELFTFAIVLLLANYIESAENFYSSFLSYNLVSSFSLIAQFLAILNISKDQSLINSNDFTNILIFTTLSTKLGIGVFTFYTYRIYAGLPFKVSLVHLTTTKQGYFLALLIATEFINFNLDIILTLVITSILSAIFIFVINQEFIATLTASSLTQFIIAILPFYNYTFNNSLDILSIYFVSLLLLIAIFLTSYTHKKVRLMNFNMIYQNFNSNLLAIIITLVIFTSLAGVPPTVGIYSKVLGLISISNSPVLSVLFILSTIFPIYFYLYQLKLIAFSNTVKINNKNYYSLFFLTFMFCILGTLHNVFNISIILI